MRCELPLHIAIRNGAAAEVALAILEAYPAAVGEETTWREVVERGPNGVRTSLSMHTERHASLILVIHRETRRGMTRGTR